MQKISSQKWKLSQKWLQPFSPSSPLAHLIMIASTFMGYKYKKGIKEFSHSPKCVKGHICVFHKCLVKVKKFSYLALKSNLWFVKFSFQDDHEHCKMQR